MKSDIIYLRTSTEEQTPENQLSDVLTLVKSADYDLFIEKQSAWKDSLKARPVFSKIREAIMNKEIKRLYIWDFDRLYRNRVQFVNFWTLCKMNNVQVLSFRQNILSQTETMQEPFKSVIETFIVQFVSWLAEEESNKKSERVRIAFKNHGGEKWGRPALEKKTVYEIMRRRNNGESLRVIAEAVKVSKSAVHKTIKENSQLLFK